MAITHKCKQAPARGRSATAAAVVSRYRREFYVVVHDRAGVQAVIIPDELTGTDLLIAGSVGPIGRYSKHLSKLWGRGAVWGLPSYIDVLEKLVDAPFPRHTVCTLR